MKILNRVLLLALFILMVVLAPRGQGQTTPQKTEPTTAAPSVAGSATDTQKKNIQAYIDLMRKDVRQQKAEIMGSVMILSAADAAKFWPIYSEYDAELTKLNNQRVETIKQYVADYEHMTDDEADQLIQKSMAYQKQRAELLDKTYEKVKQALGGITAARFALVEHQLLLLIDLQVVSSLPIVGQS
jgi:hypothetical protein